ncbi:uncharacterized protein [Misgurnus anguillicaudatus]|uniref:uncharacterized protein isoform X2 n=2 Tax=Misgurnus anguillicaudatus TaxID=75329 RepID=UPI003CCF0451
MACAQQSAAEYLRTCRCKLVTRMQNFPLIIENLYQQKVFNDHDVDAVKAERTEFDKARCILDRVIKKGEMASYELLKILDFTRRRTLHPDLHYWISCFSFREDADTVYLLGTKPCQNYQIQLKKKAEDILKKQWQQNSKYLQNKKEANFSYVPLVLETDAVVKTAHCKIKMKCKKFSKLRPKKLTSYIPDKQEALTPEDLLKWKNKNILLIGKPGIGKTTVVQQILKTWTDKDDKKPEYMFYFDESVLSHSSNLVNLESFLFDMNLKPKEKNRREIFQDIEENCENVVIVFDGVSSVHKHFILKKIINRELLPEAKIIITCRSELEDDPLYSDWRSKKVYVQGFSEESIRKYYQMMLGHNPDLLNVVLNNQELFSLSYVPMYAFMIAVFFLFKNDTELKHSHTVTEMYIHIFRDALKKHGRKILGQIDQYISEIKDQLYLMMKNSFSATEQKSLNLPEISGDQTDICSAFLKSITIRDSPTSAVTYCAFLHNTMQEFFSALWLLVNPDEIEKVLKLCQTEENKHMRYVLHFLCGLLGEHNIKLLKSLFSEDQMKKTSDWLIEKLLDTFLQPQNDDTDIDLLYVCQCLYELQSSKACLMFLEKMNHQLDPDVNLDPHQCCALSYVISQSRDKEVYLNVEDCTISDTGMKMILSCSPKIRIKLCDEPLKEIKCLLQFFHKVSQCKQKQQKDEITTSCCCTYFDPKKHKRQDLNRALLDLCSHVKDYESQTGRSLLPALQSVYKQSAPDVWIINLSKRKTSILLEVLKLQTEKKPVKLRNCRDEESQVMSLLHCLPYISQLRFEESYNETQRMSAVKFLLRICDAAVNNDINTGTNFITQLSSVCSYKTFPYHEEHDDDGDYIKIKQSDFLLDLYSHVKDYESQTGRSLLPALQSVYQSPDVWIINLSKRKTSILLEVLKLQTEKKPVKLIDCTDEESQVMSLLHCLPYISHLRLNHYYISDAAAFVSNLFIKAAKTERDTRDQMLKLLTSVCTYRSFPHERINDDAQSNFLLDLCSHVKDYESQTGRSLLPALQSVYQSPDVWIINLSKRKTSILLEVLKLQTEKKPVELIDCTDEESQVMSLLYCLPYISQLSGDKRCVLSLVKLVQFRENPDLVMSLFQALDFNLSLDGKLPSSTCRLSEEILQTLAECVYEAQEEEVTRCFLQKVGGDLTSCSFSWEKLHYFLQCEILSITLNLKERDTTLNIREILPFLNKIHFQRVDRRLLLRMIHCCSSSDVQQEASVVLLSALQHKLDFTCDSALDLTEDTQTLQLTAEDCRLISAVIQRAYKDTQTLTQLSLHDCEINTAGIHQLFSVLHSVKLHCDKWMLLQFLSHVGSGEAESLSQALGAEVDLSQTQLDLQVCRGLALVLDHSEGLTELDLSQCHLTDQSLDLLLPNLHKAEIIDFSGNNITDEGAEKMYNIVSQYSNIKTVRLFNNTIQFSEILYRDPRFEIW